MGLFSKKIKPTCITATHIEQLTDPSKTELDWPVILELCEAIAITELGEKEARKSLQRKMMSQDPRVQILSFQVLEALIQNCPKISQQLKAPSFVSDLKTLFENKSLDAQVRQRLEMFYTVWRRQYDNNPEMLRTIRSHQALAAYDDSVASRQLPHGSSHARIKKHNVHEDIEFAKNSAQLLSQTLSFTDPTKEDIRKNELIQEFHHKCQEAQRLLSAYLETVEDADIISSLINANNEILGSFKSYDEMIEQTSMNEATVNSQTLHHRHSRVNNHHIIN
ncbi:hypothetical protein BDB01DRAFT_783248, partial [Pilobolus umbonatus]